jgi:hypothetical protein
MDSQMCDKKLFWTLTESDVIKTICLQEWERPLSLHMCECQILDLNEEWVDDFFFSCDNAYMLKDHEGILCERRIKERKNYLSENKHEKFSCWVRRKMRIWKSGKKNKKREEKERR